MDDLKTIDIELIKLVQGGDSSAANKLAEKIYDPVYKISYEYCIMKTAIGTEQDARDITQDIFLKLPGTIRSFKSMSSFETWLYRVVINTAKNYLRSKSRRFKYESEKQPISPAERHEKSQVERYILELVRQLPHKLNEAVRLVYFDGMSHREASEVLNCKESTVSGRVFKAKKILNKNFDHGESIL